MARSRAHLWFIGPALVLMVLILIVPIGIAAALSFTDYSLGNSGASFVGVENYEKIFTRSTYEKMFGATFRYVGVVVPLSVGLGLGAALLIHSLKRFGDLYKTIYFLPVMAALIAMAIVWEFALHPTIGIFNSTLERGCGTVLENWGWYAKGCARTFPLWLNNRDYAIWTVCFIGIWQAFGFNMVLYLAGLTSIPRDLYAAAEMDGARSAWDRFRLVTWPMLGPTTVFVVTISLIRSFQVFDMVEAFYPHGGGPSKSVYVMMFAIYEKAIQQNLMGIGAAITVVFLGFVMVLTLIQRTLIERRTHYG
ncbi:Sugar ABC transporter, permease protein [Rhodovulum sp. P5]|uniref:carbohydrate ABC transporter permease n=1 Tax=Rhodovulum sp. P5 TaxID=1564506 RepID=UPI0009C262DF|nr:sugar ABC transporter permease [Rhodovulum sp. P5]ARE39842.1 Sugar ABC transporter, permease protein [Rhodovulum sp. P5]